MSVVFVSEPVVRVYVDYIMWSVMYVTHEDSDGYMEGGIFRDIKPYKHDLNKAADFADYMNECIADAEQFVVEQYADGSKMMKVVR
jgi:hypothetical protein